MESHDPDPTRAAAATPLMPTVLADSCVKSGRVAEGLGLTVARNSKNLPLRRSARSIAAREHRSAFTGSE